MTTSHDNATLASSKADRDRMLRILAKRQLATGQKLTIKELITELLDEYVTAHPDEA